MDNELLKFEQLKAYGITMTRQWIRQLEKQGKFPQRLRLCGRGVHWVKHEIEGYIAAAMDARVAPTPLVVTADTEQATGA